MHPHVDFTNYSYAHMRKLIDKNKMLIGHLECELADFKVLIGQFGRLLANSKCYLVNFKKLLAQHAERRISCRAGLSLHFTHPAC